MSDEEQEWIIELLIDEFGIRRTKLYPTSRLFHDLGIDGDDAGELFHKLNQRYGTDFTSLYARWNFYFGNEGVGVSWRGLLTGLAVIFLSGWLVAWLGLSKSRGFLVTLTILVLLWWGGSVRSRRKLQPITIADVAKAVGRGSWSSNIEVSK